MKTVIPQPNRKFSQAKDLPQLAQMLDDWLLALSRDINLQYPDAIGATVGRALVNVNVGTLVRVNANGTLTRADTAYEINNQTAVIPANAVVIDVISQGNVVYAQIAKVDCKIGDGPAVANAPVYLGRNGNPQITQPTTFGTFMQIVGSVINYDASSGLSTVLFSLPGQSVTI